MKSLSPPVRRIIAVALLVVAIALPYRLIVQPLLEAYAEGSEEVYKQQEMLVRYRKLADSRAHLQARLEQLQAEPSSQAGYLTGESETLVAAELQNLVRTTVERNGGRLEHTDPAGDKRRRVPARGAKGPDVDGYGRTFQIVYDLESTLPYLFLDGIDIASRERRVRGSASKRERSV